MSNQLIKSVLQQARQSAGHLDVSDPCYGLALT